MLRLGTALVVCLSLSKADLGMAQNKESTQMSGTIAVTVQSPQSHLLGGAVPVLTTIVNHTPGPITVLLPYPNPNNFRFGCSQRSFAEPKPVHYDPDERTVPTDIQSGGSHQVTYYLNRYFKFIKPGSAEFTYELDLPVMNGGQQSTFTSKIFTGTFHVKQVSASDEQLRREFDAYARQLQSSDRQKKMEAAEALAFVDVPTIVPYLLPMLRIDNLEVIGIHALARHPSPESKRAIASMLAHSSSAVVAAALEEVDRLGIPIQRQEVQKLLLSEKARRPSREDLPLLSRVISTGSEAVKNRARAYQQVLNAQ